MAVAVITPALKLPEPSLATIVLAVLADVALLVIVTAPEVPPPLKPVPDTDTLSISPASLVKLNCPVELL